MPIAMACLLGFDILCPNFCNAQKDSMNDLRLFQIQTCKIVFQFFNGVQKGQKNLIIDKWGLLEREEVFAYTGNSPRHPDSTIPMNLFHTFHMLNMVTQTDEYLIDLNGRTGIKRGRQFSNAVDTVSNGKIMRKDTILGRECIVKEFENGMTIWFWKGIALKKQNAHETNLDIGEVAVSIDESYVIKRDDFSIPQNVALTEVKF